MLGVFVLAFFVKRVGANAAFCGVLAGQVTVFLAVAKFTPIAYLWYYVIGLVVIAVALPISSRVDARI